MCAATVWKTEMGYAPVWMAFNNMSFNALYNINKKSSNTDLIYQWYVYNEVKNSITYKRKHGIFRKKR